MFTMSSMTPSEIRGEIRVASPVYRLGPLTDLDGKRWDVGAIIGDTVCAVPLDELHPYFSDTSNGSYGLVTQQWHPYRVRVEEA